MEAIAAVSSIAGILSLIGQAIDNTTKLRNFLSDVSSASETVAQLLHDLDSLVQTLDAVNGLVKLLPPGFRNSNVVSLQLRVEAYTKDVLNWSKVAKNLRPAQDGAKAWLSRFSIATNIRYVKDIRDELDRHKQTISLDLTLLGRTLDISTTTNVNDIGRGMTASLFMIEEQNSVLERIQACTETGMHSSTASARSLRSIATSLSRLESLASSAARSSVSQKRRKGGSPRAKSWSGSKRVDSGYYSVRRKSGKSAMGKRASSVSAISTCAAPHISDANISILQDGHISEASWESQSLAGNGEDNEEAWTVELEDSKNANPESPAPAIKESKPSGTNLHIDRALHEQYRVFHKLTQRFTEAIYPPEVIEYIYLIQLIKDYENKVNVLNLLQFGSNVDELLLQFPGLPVETDLYILQQERDALQNRLETLRDQLQILRRRCISRGYALYDIDYRFGLLGTEDNSATRNGDWDPNSNLLQRTRQTPSEILKFEVLQSNSKLLGSWSSNRDRVNRWLLHCLQTDDTQAQLHMSMLADSPTNDTNWARQVLKYWYMDEAALGGDLQVSLTDGAVHSHTMGSNGFDFDMSRTTSRHFKHEPRRIPLVF